MAHQLETGELCFSHEELTDYTVQQTFTLLEYLAKKRNIILALKGEWSLVQLDYAPSMPLARAEADLYFGIDRIAKHKKTMEKLKERVDDSPKINPMSNTSQLHSVIREMITRIDAALGRGEEYGDNWVTPLGGLQDLIGAREVAGKAIEKKESADELPSFQELLKNVEEKK